MPAVVVAGYRLALLLLQQLVQLAKVVAESGARYLPMGQQEPQTPVEVEVV